MNPKFRFRRARGLVSYLPGTTEVCSSAGARLSGGQPEIWGTMSLPLIARSKSDDVRFVLSREFPHAAQDVLYQIEPLAALPRIPNRVPSLGEQYRFHFDMTQCIGCKCCVVACNEQNGNPADIHWRRVGRHIRRAFDVA